MVLRVVNRGALGELWLPWCVERASPTRVVPVDREPARRGEARQLRVRDVDEPGPWTALHDNDGRRSAERIGALALTMQKTASAGTLILAAGPPLPSDQWPQAFVLPEGPMLHEACHRACALYLSRVETFELSVLLHETFGDWTIYDSGSLRADR